jgi:hypothetical protein
MLPLVSNRATGIPNLNRPVSEIARFIENYQEIQSGGRFARSGREIFWAKTL